MRVLKKIEKNEFKRWLFYHINTNDKNIYKEANNPNKIGIFQITAGTGAFMVESIKPNDFDELNACSAFARPGTMDFVPQYIKNRENGKSPYPKIVADILSETHSIILYQEQVMAVFNKIGGFTLEETNTIRGLMKKLGKLEKKKEDLDAWDEVIKIFQNGAQEKGISKIEAKKIADDLLKMSSYSFNKCFSGDMVIDKDNSARWMPTIEEMYLVMNNKEWSESNGHGSLHYKYKNSGYVSGFSLNEDGKLYKNKIRNVFFQGKKVVYRIMIENGKSIEVTSNHRFPVKVDNEIEYRSIDSGLSTNDFLFSNEGYEVTEFKGRYNFTNETNESREYKSAIYYGNGEDNAGFIDGESVKFSKNRDILLEHTSDVCPHCLKVMSRKECHHIDGNRHNNELENLIILCPSCHKKEDYKIGRNRKGDKGKIVSLSKIISIEKIGIKNTYDVEMDDPYHTVSINGIIAHNSHSTAYTYLSVITLYLSYYFRKYFYSSVLHYEVGRDKYLLDRLRAVKIQGYKILPPDINKSSKFIAPVKGSIDELIFGLEDIKHVGGNPADVILNGQPYKDFIDFYLKIQGNRVTIRAVRALICIGAFDGLHSDRKRLLTKVDRFWEQKKTIKVEEKLRFLWNNIEKQIDALPGLDATQEDLRDYEREYLGFNFFITPFSPEFMEKINTLKQKGLAENCFADVSRSSVKVPVVVCSMRVFNDKNNKEMAFLELEDYTGDRISIPVFQSFWMHVKAFIIQSKVHLINLYRQKKDDGSEQIMFGRSGFAKQHEVERFIKRLDNL